MAYHIVALVVAYKRPQSDPALPFAFTVLPVLLALGWLSAYAVMSALLCQHDTHVVIFNTTVAIPQTMRITQKLQVMLDPFVCVILADLAFKSQTRRSALLHCDGDDVESDCWSRNTDDVSIRSEPIPLAGRT